jgi:hypothetical protein
MNVKEIFKGHSLDASISTYVMMLFGMTIVLYMMGFQNMWTFWGSQTAAITGEGSSSAGIASPYLFDSATVLIIIIAILSAMVISYGLVVKYLGGSQVLAYIIPAALMIAFLNIFIFPVWSVSDELLFANNILPLAAFLSAFLNLFLFLGIIEFIRSGTT